MAHDWFHQRQQELFGTPHPVALVTGSAAPRVGRSVAELLLERGFRVALHGHQDEPEDSRLIHGYAQRGHSVQLVVGAIQEAANVHTWLDQILQSWGRVDLLVNSAAIWQPKNLEQTQVDDLQRHFEVNCLGSFVTSQIFGLQMVAQSCGGAIVQIGDWAVARPYTGFSAYFVSKGSIETMTRSLAVELAGRNNRVRVNAILPGPVMIAEGVSERRQQQIVSDSLLQRAGRPEDVAEAVYFLATSPFITGVCLPVDGGRSIYSGPTADPAAHPDT
ncbi:MAG: SDR family oxidoreductase [Pirellulaceae bacterium]|nr:SDR family oxidoreductase [Pirellulaceae bacterium]